MHNRFAKYFQWCKVSVVYGGTPITKDKEMLKGADSPHIMIGTPGTYIMTLWRSDAVTYYIVLNFLIFFDGHFNSRFVVLEE